jgi:hypothetical protein
VASAYTAAIDTDGVVEIPDFLPPKAFDAVMAEFQKLRSGLEFRRFREHEGRLMVARLMLHERPAGAPKFNEFLGRNPVIQGLAAHVAKVYPTPFPFLELTIYKAVDVSLEDNDEENLLHADLHSPTLKCFYYLHDVTAGNGAFVYARGSARLTVERLRYEYDLSVRTARLRRGDVNLPQDSVVRRGSTLRAIMTAEQRKRLGIVETQFPVKANTLVAANNMGFHRRGEFSSTAERISVVINFRHLQRPFLT